MAKSSLAMLNAIDCHGSQAGCIVLERSLASCGSRRFLRTLFKGLILLSAAGVMPMAVPIDGKFLHAKTA